MNIIDAIDGALNDYAVSSDAMRWTAEPPKPERVSTTVWRLADTVYRPASPEQIDAAVRSFSEAFQRSAAQMAEAFSHIAEELQRIKPLLDDLGVLPDGPPDDPRERALWLHQNRNTGPSRDLVRQRRPRRIA